MTTGGSEADITGRMFIVYGFDGGAIACAILGAPEELALVSSVARVSKDNCHNIAAIKRGTKTAKAAWDLNGKKVHDKVEALRSLPVLNEYNCKHTFSG